MTDYRRRMNEQRGRICPITAFFSFMDNPIVTYGNNEPWIACLDLGYIFKMRQRVFGVTFSMRQHGVLTLPRLYI
jgi:hypothetical protein